MAPYQGIRSTHCHLPRTRRHGSSPVGDAEGERRARPALRFQSRASVFTGDGRSRGRAPCGEAAAGAPGGWKRPRRALLEALGWQGPCCHSGLQDCGKRVSHRIYGHLLRQPQEANTSWVRDQLQRTCKLSTEPGPATVYGLPPPRAPGLWGRPPPQLSAPQRMPLPASLTPLSSSFLYITCLSGVLSFSKFLCGLVRCRRLTS